MSSKKDVFRNTEALGQGMDLTKVQGTISGKNLGNNPLGADFRKIRLAKTMLIHQKFQHLSPGNRRNGFMVFFPSFDHRSQCLHKSGERMGLIVPYAIQKGVQNFHGILVLVPGPDMEKILQGLPTVDKTFNIDGRFHFQSPRSYSEWVRTCRT